MYVANGDLDEIEVIDTTKDAVSGLISVARPGYNYKGSNPTPYASSQRDGGERKTPCFSFWETLCRVSAAPTG
jgi:hypothetical protein